MRLKLGVLVLTTGFVISACVPIDILAAVVGNRRDEAARTMRARLISRPTSEIFSCLGLPGKSAVNGDTQYLEFTSSGASPNGLGDDDTLTCTATFEAVNGRITAIGLKGSKNNHRTDIVPQCAVMLSPCAPEVTYPTY